jgi:hypothetical protein
MDEVQKPNNSDLKYCVSVGIQCAVNCRVVNNKMAGVATGSSENEKRGFILRCIQGYKSLPALWVVKSKEHRNHKKKKRRMCKFDSQILRRRNQKI